MTLRPLLAALAVLALPACDFDVKPTPDVDPSDPGYDPGEDPGEDPDDMPPSLPPDDEQPGEEPSEPPPDPEPYPEPEPQPEPEPEPEPEPQPEPQPWPDVPPSEVIQDCDIASGYQSDGWQSESDPAVKLYLGAVYQTRSDHSFDNHPLGEGVVHFDRPGESVLALSAYEPTHWTVTVGEGAALTKVILLGYHAQSASVPDGVEVEAHFYDGGDSGFEACGYALPSDGQGCATESLIAQLEAHTGLPLFRFDGCYDARTFAYAP